MNTSYTLTYSLTGLGMKDSGDWIYLVRVYSYFSFFDHTWNHHNKKGCDLPGIKITFKKYML